MTSNVGFIIYRETGAWKVMINYIIAYLNDVYMAKT